MKKTAQIVLISLLFLSSCERKKKENLFFEPFQKATQLTLKLNKMVASKNLELKWRDRKKSPISHSSLSTISSQSSVPATQSQNFEIDVYADSTQQWTGKRNTIWNSWSSTNGHGFAFLKNPSKVTESKFQIREMKNVRIMGGYKQAEKHHWLKEIKNGKPICDFTGLIAILQAELDHGIQPAIVLDQVPWALAHWKEGYAYGKDKPSAESVKYWWKNYGYCGPAKDVEIWQKYVKQFVQACVTAFGKEEVTKWMFRVGTEPNNSRHWLASWEDYQRHYDYTVEAVLEVIPNAYIGPGNFIGMWLATEGAGANKDKWNGHKIGSVEQFLEHCASGTNYATGKTGTRMCFLAFSTYTNLATKTPTPNALPFDPCFRKARALLDGKYKSLHKYVKDNPAIPEWFAIEAHEYGDLPSLAGAEWLWTTEWMAGMHAYVLDLAYNKYGVTKTSFWFQKIGYHHFYPYVRVNQMLSQMEGGTLVKVNKKTISENTKVKYGAISAWKEGSLYVLMYNFNWDPLHQGTLKGKRNHRIDNTITLTIDGKSISKDSKWQLDHTIINEKIGNASWYHELRNDLDAHPKLQKKSSNYCVRNPKEAWKGPVDDILLSKGKYKKNGLFEKYERLSEIGVVGKKIEVSLIEGQLIYKSEPYTQSGVQLLKFTALK